jgi:hypothetical protein
MSRLDARASRSRRPASDQGPGLPLDQGSQNRRSAASTRSRVPLRRKRPAGTRGSGDIDEPSAVTERARSSGDHAASEIDAPGPRLTPTCGGRTRRPRTEEWPLPDDHPRSRCQLGALDPRSPITEEGSTTVPVPPPVLAAGTFFFRSRHRPERRRMRAFAAIYPNHRPRRKPCLGPLPSLSAHFLRRNRTTAFLVRMSEASKSMS